MQDHSGELYEVKVTTADLGEALRRDPDRLRVCNCIVAVAIERATGAKVVSMGGTTCSLQWPDERGVQDWGWWPGQFDRSTGGRAIVKIEEAYDNREDHVLLTLLPAVAQLRVSR